MTDFDDRLLDFGSTPTTGAEVGCDCCGFKITGSLRSKCMICPDYDLCSSCFEANEHDHEHQDFWKITKSTPRVTSERTPWVSASVGTVPKGSLVAGHNKPNGCDVVVARATSSDDLIPGSLIPTHGVCWVCWNDGLLDAPRSYETLMLSPDEVRWVKSNNGEFLPWAIAGGITAEGEILYIGRVFHEGETLVGKVHRSRQSLFIPYQGDEVPFNEYELLVLKNE